MQFRLKLCYSTKSIVLSDSYRVHSNRWGGEYEEQGTSWEFRYRGLFVTVLIIQAVYGKAWQSRPEDLTP